jgi:cytochrome c biogenesis protein ResB
LQNQLRPAQQRQLRDNGELVIGGGGFMRVLAEHRSFSPQGALGAALSTIKRFLLRRSVVTVEIVGLTLAGIVGASLPQLGIAPGEDVVRLYQNGPVLASLVEFFTLDNVFQSPWFLALSLLTAASLLVTVFDQLRRLRVTWSQPATLAEMRDAPLRAEFDRPSNLDAAAANCAQTVAAKTSGRIGLIGSPLFHMGLLLIMFAGALRALFAVDAVVDLLEGETLPPTAEAWGAQWPGVAAEPLRLDMPITLESVTATRYDTGALRDLRARLSLHGQEQWKQEEIAINREVRAPGGRLFLGGDFGPAALIEWTEVGDEPVRQAVMLRSPGYDTYRKASYVQGFIKVYLRTEVDRAGTHPEYLEVRIVDNKTRALLFGGRMRIGDEVSLEGGQSLKLHGMPFWTRLRANRDPALWLVFLGFALALAGAAIMFTVVKVDTCVAVTPTGDRERVFVALNAQRFAPMYQERFQKLVREHGGPA